MIKNSAWIAAFSAAFAIGLASAAQADEQFNQDLAGPGVYFGSGNGTSPQQFTTNTANGVEIALRSKISGSQAGQIVPIGNTYFIPLGAFFNFDYSFNPTAGGTLSGPTDPSTPSITALITVLDVGNGHTATFDPSAIPDNALGGPFGAPGGYQNSEKISFGFLDPTYNKNVSDTFHITFTVTGLDAGPLSVTNTVVLGAGAPEPASWALMILGFGGVGATLRRSRKTAAAATA
ncbi:MAG TPA: PEPxxWA-CTERM sorting domain-containing protein [Phenylobacterium sp.]|nr:PEPxxWA-CTERM sorting domain-containing protein [Phenylobacterium sp.]